MRIRTIKPEFFQHEELFDAEKESGLPLRVAFAGLWCAADREGRFKWRPRRLGVQILPYDDADFSRVLDALATRGFVVKYASLTGGEREFFGLIPSFTTHQVINNRERDSELPNPDDCEVCDACRTREARVTHAGKAEGKGMEGNKEGKGRDFCPDPPDECVLIWKNSPPISHERSSKVKLADEWRKLPKKHRPDVETLKEALAAWNRCSKWSNGFAEGIHLWVKNRQWENLPDPASNGATTRRAEKASREYDEEVDGMTVFHELDCTPEDL